MCVCSMYSLYICPACFVVSALFCRSFTLLPERPTKISSYTCRFVYWDRNMRSHPFQISKLSIFSPIIAQITTYCAGVKITLVSWRKERERERGLPSQMTLVEQSIFLMDYIKMKALTECTLTLKILAIIGSQNQQEHSV